MAPSETEMHTVTPKQRAFIDEFLKDRNATQAAIRAGYSERTAYSAGSRLLKNVEVSSEIERALNRISERAELKAAMVLDEIRKLAFANLSKAFSDDGRLLHPKDMPEELKTALSLVESEDIFAGRGPMRQKIGETKRIKLHDKVRALEMLAKHFNLLNGPLELSPAEDTSAPLTPEAVAKIEKRLKELDEIREKCGDD